MNAGQANITAHGAHARRGKVVVFMPAYHAARSLRAVYEKIPAGVVDDVVVVDDHSRDGIEEAAAELGLRCFVNSRTLGYGGNVKVCIQRSLALDADILIELHPDDQYDPAAIPAALQQLDDGCDVVIGSRFHTVGAVRRHGMPSWKYAINRLSTVPARLVLGCELTDFHCGFRAYRRRLFERVAYEHNSDDYLFSFEIIAQTRHAGLTIGEVPVVCRYFPGVTQIDVRRSMIYGVGALRTLAAYAHARRGRRVAPIFAPPRRRGRDDDGTKVAT